jgi:hypothetical protein
LYNIIWLHKESLKGKRKQEIRNLNKGRYHIYKLNKTPQKKKTFDIKVRTLNLRLYGIKKRYHPWQHLKIKFKRLSKSYTLLWFNLLNVKIVIWVFSLCRVYYFRKLNFSILMLRKIFSPFDTIIRLSSLMFVAVDLIFLEKDCNNAATENEPTQKKTWCNCPITT